MAPNNRNNRRNRQPQGPGIEQQVVEGIFKAIGFLVMLPFRKRGGKNGGSRSGLVSATQAQEFAAHWDLVDLYARKPDSFALAVSEADKLFDTALQAAHVPGTTMGERLKAAESRFDSNLYSSLWEAHKLRNRLAHELGTQVSASDVQQALQCFKSGLRTLGVFL